MNCSSAGSSHLEGHKINRVTKGNTAGSPMETATSALALLEASFLTREWGLCFSWHFLGSHSLSVFCLVTCQLYCKAKHHWKDTAYQTSPTWGNYFSFPQIVGRISASDVDQQRQGKAQLGAIRFRNSSITTTCLPALADCIGANYIKLADGMCWGWTELFE